MVRAMICDREFAMSDVNRKNKIRTIKKNCIFLIFTYELISGTISTIKKARLYRCLSSDGRTKNDPTPGPNDGAVIATFYFRFPALRAGTRNGSIFASNFGFTRKRNITMRL